MIFAINQFQTMQSLHLLGEKILEKKKKKKNKEKIKKSCFFFSKGSPYL